MYRVSSWQVNHLEELWGTSPIRQDQGLLADTVSFLVTCLPEIIMHSLLPQLLRACCTVLRNCLLVLYNLNCRDHCVKYYEVVLKFY